MAEHNFKKAEDLLDWHRELIKNHSYRDRQLLELQSMWESPIQTSDTGRTIWVNNEPWTATRVIVNLGTDGTRSFKPFAPPDEKQDARERRAEMTRIERLFVAHWEETDDRFHRSRRDTHRRELFYYMAVHGWYAGFDWVEDAKKGGAWPIFSDLWNPLDTHPEMDSTAIAHRFMMTYGKFKRQFGKNRPGGKSVPGFELKLMKGSREELPDDTRLFGLSYWDDETNMVVAMDRAGKPYLVKKQIEHGLDHNPAFCQPVDAPPFRHAATNSDGEILSQPQPEDSRYLAYVGQSPMLGYKTAYRYASELAEQIATVVERWASPWVLIKTEEGKWVPFDTSNPDPAFFENTTVVDVIAPPKFPADDRAWFAAVQSEISKASFSPSMYGQVGASEATSALAMMRQTNNYIIQPLILQAQRGYEMSCNNIASQLRERGKQYGKKIGGKVVGYRSRAWIEYFDMGDLPEGLRLVVELKGAGIKADPLQTLLAIGQIAQLPVSPMSMEDMLDFLLELDAPEETVARALQEKLVTNPKVIEMMSPASTLFAFADEFERRGDERSRTIAAMYRAQGMAAIEDITKEAMGGKKTEPALPPGAGPALPPGPEPGMGPPPEMGGAPGMIVPPPGAPPGAPPVILGPNGSPLPPAPLPAPPGGPGLGPPGAPLPGSTAPPAVHPALQQLLMLIAQRRAQGVG